MARTVDEFPGLSVERCTFTSNNGQKLAGYRYSKSDTTPKGVVVMAHGFGPGGQCVYMDVADYFTSNGYLVFAFDATGVDNSEGDSMVGLQQGVIDLGHAIDYVEQDSVLGNYPVVLWGHSWGAYCVSSVLADHPEVKAVAAVSGFNKPSDTISYSMHAEEGDRASLITTFLGLMEKQRFGKYAGYTGLKGFASTDAGVMIVQSADDVYVPVSLGYDLYYAQYRNDRRFVFKLYQDRQHLYVYHTDAARQYATAYDAVKAAYFTAQGVARPTVAESAEYAISHPFDKAAGYADDLELMDQIRDFYDQYCGS